MKHFSKFFSFNHFPTDESTKSQRTIHEKDSFHVKHNSDTDYDINTELNKIGTFVRSGLVVLSVVLLASIAIAYGQKNLENTTTTSGNLISNKKLPIYCVDEKEKKVALSFDAAWGAYNLMIIFRQMT